MLPKKHRLSRKEFWQVRKTGKKLFLNNYLVFNSPADSLKASLVISKKVAKKAVDRNKLRRQIYNHLYNNYKNYNNYLIVYLQKSEVDYSELDKVLSKIS